MIKRLRHTASVGALMTVLATGLLVAGASPALADTSQATANAATLSLNGAPLVTTGTCSVSNLGTPPPDECNETPPLGILGTQAAIEAGLLVQQAIANPDGTSAACAGLIGAGGTIQIGAGGDCIFVPGGPSGGVVIDAGGLAVIRADAILAECASTIAGGTAVVTLVNATVQVLGGDPTPLTSIPAPNTTVLGLGALLDVTLNVQPPDTLPPPPAGSVGATALDLEVLSAVPLLPPLIELTIGTVTCGPNVDTAAIPVIPLEGLPIALATLAGAGVIALVIHRRRRIASESSLV